MNIVANMRQLYNRFADPAGFHDICLVIYKASDHANPADVSATWDNLIEATHSAALSRIETEGAQAPQPYETIISVVSNLAYKLNRSEFTFPPEMLVRKLEAYAVEKQRGVGPSTWVMDLFFEVGISYERIVTVLESMIHEPIPPFNSAKNQRVILNDTLYTIGKWYQDCVRHNTQLFHGNEMWVDELLVTLQKNGLDGTKAEEARELRVRIAAALRR